MVKYIYLLIILGSIRELRHFVRSFVNRHDDKDDGHVRERMTGHGVIEVVGYGRRKKVW